MIAEYVQVTYWNAKSSKEADCMHLWDGDWMLFIVMLLIAMYQRCILITVRLLIIGHYDGLCLTPQWWARWPTTRLHTHITNQAITAITYDLTWPAYSNHTIWPDLRSTWQWVLIRSQSTVSCIVIMCFYLTSNIYLLFLLAFPQFINMKSQL